jgi:pimeloyl-ACP methyl ester carboxylesterase
MANLFDQYPAPGRMVQVQNHHLHIQCHGHAGPTVVFEAGQAEFSLDWMLVQAKVGSFARACTYDRAGLGWSEAGPYPRTPRQVVAELHDLLVAAEIPKPYLMVAHSMGSRYARLYTQLYPGDVMGMVLVDGYHESFDNALGTEQFRVLMRVRTRQYRLREGAARLGVARLFGRQVFGLLGADYRNMPPPERQRYLLLVTRPHAMAITIDEFEQAVAADSTAVNIPNDLPLRILAHGIPWPYPAYERIWQESQRLATSWSSRSKLVVAEQSGHTIMLAQPDLVVDAIREVIEEASSSFIDHFA